MTQRAQVLNFTQAAALIGRKRKALEPREVKLTRCHDGVWRVLAEAPKFDKGGFGSTAEFIHKAKQSDWDAYRDNLYDKMLKGKKGNGFPR